MTREAVVEDKRESVAPRVRHQCLQSNDFLLSLSLVMAAPLQAGGYTVTTTYSPGGEGRMTDYLYDPVG